MNALISRELRHKIDMCRRKGGKVLEFYEKQQFAPIMVRDYHYAVCQLWTMIGQNGKPLRPWQH